MTATVRVHLLTYHRPKLLPRALDSLIRQTFRDWVCELHNDDPDDPGPAELVARVGDPRVTVVTHSENWGLVRGFNEVFRHRDTRYVTVLEDDNSWDPEFLGTMVRLLDEHPEASAGWANLRLWQELPDGTWEMNDRCIWEFTDRPRVELVPGPSCRSALTAVASQGAMLWRSETGATAVVPEWVTPSAMEAVRERLMPWPLMFHTRPLGNYALTIGSVRSRDSWRYGRDQSILLGSFCTALRHEPAVIQLVLEHLRTGRQYNGHGAALAALAFPASRFLLRYLQWQDWWYLLRGAVRRPLNTLSQLLPSRESKRLFTQLADPQLSFFIRLLEQGSVEEWKFTGSGAIAAVVGGKGGD